MFLGFTVYVKFGSGENWRRAENVVRLFSDCFSREQPFSSYLNNFSEILWSLTVGFCLFCLALLRFFHPQRRINSFLLYSTALIALLMLDDLFRFSLILALFLGVPKLLMYVLYGIAFLFLGFYFKRKVVSTPYGILIAGLFLFVFSNTVDLLPLQGQATPVVLEEGSKLLGLLNLTYYYWSVCWSEATRSLTINRDSVNSV
ncbi:hypothetical protein [Lusitaniella coriacea]|uniref:hypothetical protein n=1 Tax=Lusitaniella coriacea TaxID=1983105 RepID=UPI003CEA4246